MAQGGPRPVEELRGQAHEGFGIPGGRFGVPKDENVPVGDHHRVRDDETTSKLGDQPEPAVHAPPQSPPPPPSTAEFTRASASGRCPFAAGKPSSPPRGCHVTVDGVDRRSGGRMWRLQRIPTVDDGGGLGDGGGGDCGCA
ncbi:unnamed protein product [Cochlearia groenlandica]